MKLSESEWQIMNALWQRHPATARDLMDYLPEDVQWAYTTVKTMLTRLVAKKAISERKRGNISVYEPLISRKKARRSALYSFLNQAFDGAVEPLLSFIVKDQKLSEKQRQELIRLLQDEESPDNQGNVKKGKTPHGKK
jgi:BlaI family transcriptional regulator, penicillinase repressor